MFIYTYTYIGTMEIVLLRLALKEKPPESGSGEDRQILNPHYYLCD